MNAERLHQITEQYTRLSIAVLGDFCLDRYLEIDPARTERSLETGLPVHNVVRVRCQPGGAGTVLNNLVALGVKRIIPIGFVGDDGEGFELQRALQALPSVESYHLLQTPLRDTFTYVKPLIVEPGRPPLELNRFDHKNWTPTPSAVELQLIASLNRQADRIDALVVMDQVDLPDTGVVTTAVRDAVRQVASRRPSLPILADCRRGLNGFPSIHWKMNRNEFGKLLGAPPPDDLAGLKKAASDLARRQRHGVFVTLAEAGLLAASPDGECTYCPALPLRGEIDIVGAGDSVAANLSAALAAGALPGEAAELANTAASVVIHQLGTTGTASVPQIAELHGTRRYGMAMATSPATL
jgi:rfaE bifunctional protein kinase chain/domain